MPDAFFTSTPDAGRFVATEATVGPWSPALQHGGPPAALLVRHSELEAAADTGRDDLDALRVSLDFFGPVPVGEVQLRATTVRSGRSAVLVDAELVAGGRTCLRSRTWLIRRAPAHSTPAVSGPPAHPGPDGLAPIDNVGSWAFPYGRHIEWRPVAGRLTDPGPVVVWAKGSVPVVDDEQPSGLQRVALVADSTSGLSAEVGWDEWSFVNVDLDVHLSRAPVGEWTLLESRSRLAGTGTGLATSTVHDAAGVVGASAQTLVVQPLP